ncbi:hypothetical protein T4D_12293 [Trichinella pseudospiralis]|uniref:Uncharacterized protein n=1 Tax=Trichinella pseudospiralis TaxID=6337 RepID=A0A0V1F6F6_TRIPS|nr:hypothetical protein T4D_11719 [Trichinella pseudospiralis]KRY81611.1 hypothetical protein T4D_12293 [Trichinella pseudospiralis]
MPQGNSVKEVIHQKDEEKSPKSKQQVSGSSTILWVVLNLRSLLLKPCETITLLLWKFCTEQRHSETKRDKSDSLERSRKESERDAPIPDDFIEGRALWSG